MMSIITVCFLFFMLCVQAQNETSPFSLDANFFYGNITEHNTDISHLITGHPSGIILSYNKKTFGEKAWQSRYNYPDYGFSFSYQNLKNEFLGENLALYAHYNFYFLKRNLMLRIGQGLAYTNSPYHKKDNFRNIAFGSRFMSSTYLMLNYKKENIFK